MEPKSGIGRVSDGESVDALIQLLNLICLAVVGFNSGGSRIETDYLFPKSLIVT